MRKLKQKLIGFLYAWLERLNARETQEEYEARLQQIREFFHEVLPSIDEKWQGKAIIEGGTFNYFALPSGNLPKYEFAVPEIPLYVVVAGICSADWSLARLRGIKRATWEAYQADLDCIAQITPKLATINMAAEPRIIIIKWNDSINHYALADKVAGLIR